MIRRVTDFMSWLGGGDPDIMAGMPRSRARFVQMAGVLLTTSGIAVLSMIFALHDGVKVPLFAALVFGVLWGFVILNLDRFLVLSMDNAGSRWNLLLMAVPRLALAAVLSLVISTPLVLRVFASDINAQLKITQLVNSANEAKLEKNSKEVQDYNKAQQKITADQAILAGQVPAAAYTPLQTDMANVTRLTPIVQSDFQQKNAADEKWKCEISGQTGAGCPTASGLSGNGPRATTDQQAYESDAATYDQDNAQLQHWLAKEKTDQAAASRLQTTAVATDQQQAKKDLATQIALVAQLEPVIQSVEAQDTQANQANTGILAQLQALSDASARDPVLNTARLAVLAVFFLIEILPVTVKVLLSLARPTPYDLVARAKDEEAADKARKELAENRRIAEVESEARVGVATDMAARKEDLGKEANAHVADEMRKILGKVLDQWSFDAQDRFTASLGKPPGTGGTPPANGSTPYANGGARAGTESTSFGDDAEADHPTRDALSPGYLPDGTDL
jgi:Domain of unknown function (DUF4407)